MAWSTRQVAELAGTTVKAVRHYHKLGLLAEPERTANGYKQYGVAELTRLLRIRRLTELGLSLPQIAQLGDTTEHPAQILRELDAELAAGIDRLQRLRAELAPILEHGWPTDLPAEWAPLISEMSANDRALLVVQARLLDAEGLKTWQRFLAEYVEDPAVGEFDRLAPDADEPTRADLVDRLSEHFATIRTEFPELQESRTTAPGGPGHVGRTIDLAMNDLYNPAQLDVLQRIRNRRK
ncbi:MerR family transcriptional regulator [Kribbella sandramycini]|uniref:DNA-binding transcriptional MerR regulator n=1 Tax=Kribbella sandramycini TaxID=60450 RepID=A0A7Y4P0V3_9ACTN|nr:MerR family transcriptional regulator [Kribbella sandramycini]MBB6565179.1 DNA-binding transcriptional MerR regulator [Kribbella sandramycini]NOL41449.1 MerR family transcriptional regulator [Kribbella sandramycini]